MSKMSNTENMPPTATINLAKDSLKTGVQVKATIKSKQVLDSGRKKLQTLQPSSKNQTLLVGADGQLRMSGSKKDKEFKVFADPTASSTPEKKCDGASLTDSAIQAVPVVSEGSSQVEEEDTAVARAQAEMYGEEELGTDYWRDLAEKRREALEQSLIENEELHTSLTMVEEEKGLVEKERDSLKEMADQAEELAKIVKGLVSEVDSEGESDATKEDEEEGGDKSSSFRSIDSAELDDDEDQA